MIGSLGTNIVFEVSDKQVLTFQNLTRTVSGRWTTHETMGAKPKAEFLGADTQGVSLTITLSAALGVRPRTMLETIETMVESGTAEYLILGTAAVGSNPFRLMSASETWDCVYNGGQLAKATVTLTLEEYT